MEASWWRKTTAHLRDPCCLSRPSCGQPPFSFMSRTWTILTTTLNLSSTCSHQSGTPQRGRCTLVPKLHTMLIKCVWICSWTAQITLYFSRETIFPDAKSAGCWISTASMVKNISSGTTPWLLLLKPIPCRPWNGCGKRQTAKNLLLCPSHLTLDHLYTWLLSFEFAKMSAQGRSLSFGFCSHCHGSLKFCANRADDAKEFVVTTVLTTLILTTNIRVAWFWT